MLLLRRLYDEYQIAYESFQKDKRIAEHPIFSRLWPMFLIIGVYLLIVLKWGPKFMANRKPYKVEGLMKIYNVMQIVLNAVIFYESLRYSYMTGEFSLTCQKYDINDNSPMIKRLVRPAVLYYISKYLDLFDTIFFLLRKKFNQITFLHVYHHSLMVVGVYIYCLNLFASHFTFTGIINSFVHVCMYTYYLVAAQKPGINLERWKRNITRLQLVQFFLLAVFFLMPLLNNWCNLPTYWLLLMLLQNSFMIAMFSNFYYNSYMSKKGLKKLPSPKTTQ